MEKAQNLVIGLIFTAAVWTLLTAFSKEDKKVNKCKNCTCETGVEKCKTV